ncbi:MAG TPA: class I SAM-dependent methyltransferase [Candidatus Binatia bacterium]|jgi:SAM-dependent methyltransferase
MNRFHRWYCRSSHWRRTVRERLLPWALAGVDLGEHVLEIGPGPGLTTDVLRTRVARLTAVEIDARLAAALALRTRGTNVVVHEADATALPLADGSVTAVVCFTMMHHVPSRTLQDHVLAEAARVLVPGGTFAGSDSTDSCWMRMIHRGDTLVALDPATFAARLANAGFVDVMVSRAAGAFRFRARKPPATPSPQVTA